VKYKPTSALAVNFPEISFAEGLFFCHLCEETVDTPQAFIDHVTSSKHQNLKVSDFESGGALLLQMKKGFSRNEHLNNSMFKHAGHQPSNNWIRVTKQRQSRR